MHDVVQDKKCFYHVKNVYSIGGCRFICLFCQGPQEPVDLINHRELPSIRPGFYFHPFKLKKWEWVKGYKEFRRNMCDNL